MAIPSAEVFGSLRLRASMRLDSLASEYLRLELIDPAIATHLVGIFKLMGELVEVASAVDDAVT